VRIAFLSDVHANLPALCAALATARRLGAASVIAAGDLVGSGPHPVEVVRLLVQRGVRAIRGNVERKLLALGTGRRDLTRRLDKPRAGHLAWTALQLGPAEREWLAALPERLDLSLDGVAVRVVHGSASSDLGCVYPSVTARALPALAGEPLPRVLVCGHTHVPFTRALAGVRVVNCGSVGRPADGDARGALALVDLAAPAPPRGRIVRFAYPVEETVRDLAARGVPGAVPDELARGVRRKGV